MPQAVVPWVADTFPTAKSLNLALFTCDGTSDNPNGILFHAYRPLLFETYNRTLSLPAPSGGTQTVLSAGGSITAARMVLDTAGYYGQSSDLPGLGYYQFTSVIKGSSGDGITPGGLFVMSHFAAVKHTSTQTSVSADLVHLAGASTPGSRQAPNSTNDSTAFFCDLVNVGTATWQPAVTLRDSAGSATTNAVNTTDSSGETCRMYAIWAAASATTEGTVTYLVNGSYTFTAPQGVASVTAAALGAGAGGGAGNASGGGTEYGGGGGGGGEFAEGAVAVTPGDSYPVTVGAGGTGGVSPGGTGAAGGNSVFSGDSTTITAHGGSAGVGATTSGNGAGGAGGTGSGAPTHHNGGAGVTGATGTYGGGGGSSAGPAVAGNAGVKATGGAAPAGGGPGGDGGTLVISVVQRASANSTAATLHASFPHAVQAGSTVIAVVCGQCAPNTVNPTCVLSDGTTMTSDVSGSSPGDGKANANFAIFHVFNVTGGQTGVTVGGMTSTFRGNVAQIYEIAGLGASPSTDQSVSATGRGSTYSVQAVTASGPELWIGATGGSRDGSITIGSPGGKWVLQSQDHSDNYDALRSGYQIAPAAGTMTWKGSFSPSWNWVAGAVSYVPSAVTPGYAPVTAPSGGGGAALGASNGGNGLDGSLTLSWVSATGGGYGNPPLPSPFTGYTDGTRLGTAGDPSIDVDINSASGITDVCNFLSNAPVVRVSATAAQAIASASVVPVFSSATASLDSYSGWNSGTSTYTIQRDGLYLGHGLVAFSANSTGTRQAAFTINGTTYWGPGYKAASSGTTNATKTQVFALQAGDTVQLACRQDSGGSLNLATTDASRFFLVWLGLLGAPASTWTPPDATYRWVSGTPGSALPGIFQQHVANDLGFLCSRPYLLAYQTAAQSGLAVGSFSTVSMDMTNGLVHPGVDGDNYDGWDPSTYTYVAPVNGWWVTCGEYFTTSSSTSGATTVAGIQPSTSGGYAPSVAVDQYQRMSATATASVGSGGTVLGLMYALAGESFTPVVETLSYSASYGTLAGTSNGGLFASHFSAVWLSE
jgi:hypothetical protein